MIYYIVILIASISITVLPKIPIVNHSTSELTGSAVNNMAFVAERLGFDPEKTHDSIYNGFDSHDSSTACDRPVSGSESSWSSGTRGMGSMKPMKWPG